MKPNTHPYFGFRKKLSTALIWGGSNFKPYAFRGLLCAQLFLLLNPRSKSGDCRIARRKITMVAAAGELCQRISPFNVSTQPLPCLRNCCPKVVSKTRGKLLFQLSSLGTSQEIAPRCRWQSRPKREAFFWLSSGLWWRYEIVVFEYTYAYWMRFVVDFNWRHTFSLLTRVALWCPVFLANSFSISLLPPCISVVVTRSRDMRSLRIPTVLNIVSSSPRPKMPWSES